MQINSRTMLRSTVACTIPFTLLQISPGGKIYLCCPAWTTYGSIGTLTHKTGLKQIWNSTKSQYIRKRVLQGELYKVCNMKYCPYAIAGKSVKLDMNNERYKSVYREIKNGKTVLHTAPRTLLIAHSGRCNLRCIMCCSNETYVPEDEKLNKLIYKRELPKMLPKLSEIILTGNGDPFAMKDAREFMQQFNPKKYPKVFFSITTNGVLFNKWTWDTIKHNRFGWISVSIDAASKETYERIRRRGQWEILQKNLQLIKQLRKEQAFRSFTISFVVMKSNYQEMKDFVKMGIALGCDRILFQRVFGTAAPEENINLSHNTVIKKKIANILNDPIFSLPIVDVTTINDYRRYRNAPISPVQPLITQLFVGAYAIARRLKQAP